jgi:predicted  nucleic acid-binding Zn-ribbon protein
MPHQCVRCSKLHPDGAQEILKGCSCGARLFFYVKKSQIEEGTRILTKLSSQEKVQIEEDIRELANVNTDSGRPVILDLESIRVLKPGKYELDLVNLFKNDPLVFKLEDGKYMIDLPQVFKRTDKK